MRLGRTGFATFETVIAGLRDGAGNRCAVHEFDRLGVTVGEILDELRLELEQPFHFANEDSLLALQIVARQRDGRYGGERGPEIPLLAKRLRIRTRGRERRFFGVRRGGGSGAGGGGGS